MSFSDGMWSHSGIKCPNCGGNLKFHIPSQQLACEYCQSQFDPYSFDSKEKDAQEMKEFGGCLEDYLEGNDPAHYCVDEFDSHAEFEKWLLNAVADWIKDDPLMIEDLDQYLKLA